MKKGLGYKTILLWMVSVLLLTGCGQTAGSVFHFTFNATEAMDSEMEKAFYFDEAYDSVILHVDLALDAGSVSVEIKDLDGKILANRNFDKSGEYQIELKDVRTGEEGTIFVQANQTKKATLKMTSSVRMVKSKDKPGKENQASASGQNGQAGAQEQEELLTGKHHVNINIKDKGTIEVELDADSAPITVTNFVNLAKSGFYDGLTFHRIMKGFMMQGGDPNGDGTGGAENKIKGEFANNGIENPLSHVKGAVSMARSSIKDSASSQFFIVHEDSVFLDGDYAAFGYVTEGMEIVDDICNNTTGQDGNGIVPMENRPVIESIEVVD